MEEENVKVQRFSCPDCKRAIMVRCMEPNIKLDKQEKKRQIELLEIGCTVDIISVEEARKCEFGCKCKK